MSIKFPGRDATYSEVTAWYKSHGMEPPPARPYVEPGQRLQRAIDHAKCLGNMDIAERLEQIARTL